MLTKTNLYPSFFTAEESREIILELMETVPFTMLPACFGVKSNAHKQGTPEPLPWTDLLLSIKQFVEDRLDIDLHSAWLYSNHRNEMFSLIKEIECQEDLYGRPYALTYLGDENEGLENGSLLLLNEELNKNYPQNFFNLKKNNIPGFIIVFARKI